MACYGIIFAVTSTLQCLLQVFEGYLPPAPFRPSVRKFEHLSHFKIQSSCLPLHVFKSRHTVISETCLWDSSSKAVAVTVAFFVLLHVIILRVFTDSI